MKRIGAFLIEEIVYITALAYSYTRYSDRFAGISAAAVFIIPAAAITAVNLVHSLLDQKMKPRLTENNEGHGKWIYRFIVFACILLVFYASFSALEYYGNMPASFRTLVMISLMASVAHLMLIFAVSLRLWKDDLLTDCEYEEDISDMINENDWQN